MPRATLATCLSVLVAACSTGEGPDDTGLTAQADTVPATSDGSSGAATDASTSDASTGPATTATTTADASSGSSGDDVDPPPPECGPLTTCGVQCVDLMTDPANCGKCGVTCVIPHAVAACGAGQCALGECADGWYDCDGDLLNGCEQQLAPGQMCGLVCKPGKVELCNQFDDNCDGACDEGALPGCRHPVHRASSPTLGHFYTTDAAEAMSGDLTPEALNFFYLYDAPGMSLVPFYRCLKGDGRRFYTTSATCENAGPVEGVLGQIGTDPICGSIPLFRLYGNSDHFYTTSEVEKNNAVSMYGYKFESIAGYVWPGP